MAEGRRERNKEDKRVRILAAASELFATHGVDQVTTQQIADAADIGTGTLFLYAKNKGELLLMVQNAHYEEALSDGVAAAGTETDPVEAVMAILAPVVACNRAHVGNGRTYLREMMFGDPIEPHHARALDIALTTEAELGRALVRTTGEPADRAAAAARAMSALLLRSLASPPELSGPPEQMVTALRADVAALVAAPSRRAT